ncbi:uncharacterized protein DDB_G0283697 [Contarinia nasturtii]|uniref:uncharacterized protein DDB_G0283697 n=1 Tax=Contarinia nasturtii TaxID=265458 RepID=UPI0012D4343F|nr:uncharacterized protein DDB_G0283697 [Contarinia nasturtii]
MPKTKKSHHRSDERKGFDSDEQVSSHSIVSEEDEQIVEQKKRHRKKSSKKGKKHRSKRKHSPSESDNDSSTSSESSQNSSSEEEVVKRKKQKKHKKSKRRNRHDERNTDERKNADDEVEILHEPPKVHYISSDEDKRHHQHSKLLKRGGVGSGVEDRKRVPRENSNDRGDYKSKWDSPGDDFERKRKRESPAQRRVGGEQRNSDVRPNNYRDRNERGRESPRMQRQDRGERKHPETEVRRDRRDDTNQSEWRNRERAPEFPERFRKDDRGDLNRDRRFRGDEGRFGRPQNEFKRSFSPKGNVNRGRFDDRQDNRRDNAPRFNYNDNRREFRDSSARGERFPQERRPENKRDFNDRDMDRSRNEPQRQRDRNEHERNRNERDARDKRSPNRSADRGGIGGRGGSGERPRTPVRSNPFRRNKNPDEPSDFRHDGQKPDRNDRSSRNDSERNDRNDRSDRNDRNERNDRNDRNERNDKNGSANRRKYNNREEDNGNYTWGKTDVDKKPDETEPPVEKEKPNFGLSGKLTEDANKVNGIVIKYAEPPEARRPKRRWRLYPFKNDQSLSTIYIHRQSCFLIGREKKICEIAVDHPSCSKQHAALQYRLVNYDREDGTVGKHVRPYIIDLDSANGTFVNNNKIEPRKYFELRERDMLKFGFSSREYILLHEDSNVKEEEPIYEDDDIKSEKSE